MFFKKLDQKGSIGTAELLIVIVILLSVVFGGVDYWIIQFQFQYADHLKNQYLDTVRLNGCLESAKEVQFKERLEKLGFEDIVISVTNTNEPTIIYTEDNRAIRKVGDDIENIPEITLTAEGKFKNNIFWISSILNDSKNKEDLPFRLFGTTYTEYVERS